MSTITAISEAGLTDDLDLLFSQYFKKDDESAMNGLKSVIDKHGLQSKEVIREVGKLQRAEILEPGLYKEFRDLNIKLGDGGNGVSKVSQPVEESPPKKDDPPTTNDASAGAGDPDVLTSTDEDAIRDRLRKLEEKHRAKMANMERKLREQRAKQNNKKAKRLGLKAEEAAKIRELTAEINKLKAANKQLREEIKKNNDGIKGFKEEISQIRPKKQGSSGGSPKPSPTAKVDPKELASAVKVITDYLKENSGSKSSDIKENTGVDGALYNAAISEMKDKGKVEQKGRGPFTNYTLC